MEVANVSQGVTVVMNPQTGEILAMVSLPAYDNNKFASGISIEDFNVYLTDPARPLRNHAISDIYPPGSTFKLVTAIAAMEEGVTTAIRCGRRTAATRSRARRVASASTTGIGRASDPLAMVDAFAKSSDTFFYQMAVHTGVDPLADGRTTSASASSPASGCPARRRGSSPAPSGRAGRAGRASSPESWPRPASART